MSEPKTAGELAKIIETDYLQTNAYRYDNEGVELLVNAYVAARLAEAAERVKSLKPSAENDSPESDFIVDRTPDRAISAIQGKRSESPEGSPDNHMSDTEEIAEILPCPFCGGKAERIDLSADDPFEPNAGGSFIQCPSCLASSKLVFGEKVGLEEAWNARTGKQNLDWDSIDDAFDSFLSAVSADVPGERYERSSAERGGRWMRHLIMRVLRGGDISRAPRPEPRQTVGEVGALEYSIYTDTATDFVDRFFGMYNAQETWTAKQDIIEAVYDMVRSRDHAIAHNTRRALLARKGE